MKKIILSILVILVSFAANAQEPEKKKESKSAGATQERAINESGVSVKSKPQSKSNVKSAVAPSAPAPNDVKKEEAQKEVKKPE